MNSAQDQQVAGSERRDPDLPWGNVIRWGGWALFVAAVLLVVFVVGVVVTGQELPVPAQEALDSPESARAGYLATAELAIETQNTYSTMAVILLSAASIIIGTVLLNGTLVGRGMAYVTIAAGIASIFAPFLIIAGVPEAIGFIGLALGAVWQLVVGLKLARLH